MLNGLLLASYSVWCSCVLGGTCCGGVCHCDDGTCCDDEWRTDDGSCCENVWHPLGNDLCEEGSHLVWSSPYCCGCLEDGKVLADLCCEPGIPIHEKQAGECKQRCCDPAAPASCTDEYPADCTHTSLEGSCFIDGCPGSCCTENAEGTEVACVDVDAADCVSPAIGNNAIACGVGACLGACCKYVDDVYTDLGQMSLADCIAASGEFQGVNTVGCTTCGVLGNPQSFRCRAPFSECCCEEKTSKGAGLVFTAPRNKQRLPALDVGKSKQFTIELKTESDIRIHGELFSAYSQCLTTVVCHDEINVEPVPCGSNFKNLWIKVCWSDQGYDREDLLFPECQGMTIWLGNCEHATELYHCQTYTTYSGNGLTSDVDIILYGSAHITADGTGPLVITQPITNQGTCARTLTIDGISPLLNSINGGITDVPGGEKLTLVKDGVGTWRLGASSSFEGQTLIKQGTLIAGVSTGPSGSGVFGQGVSQETLPMVGDSSNDATGFAAMLLEDGVVLNRSLQVAAPGANQLAILGGANTSGTSIFASGQEIRIGRDVTLQAATGGTVRFASVWMDSTGTGSPANSYTIGTAGNLGTVELTSVLATTSGSVSINYGTLSVALDNKIESTTPVFIGTEASSGTLMLGINDSSLTLTALTFIGSGSFVTNTGSGALTMTSPASITVQSGTGHQISSNMVLANDLTVHVPTGTALLISGNISPSGRTLTKTGCGTLTLTGTNTVTIVDNGAALTPAFGATTPTATGFTVQITNYSSAYTWAGTATASGTVAISGTGLVTVTGVAPGTSSTATITSVSLCSNAASASVSATSLLGAALNPTFGATTATATGFTVQITNYDALYSWAGTATASGSVSINNGTGLVTVTGVAPGTSSTATITTTRAGYAGGSNTVTATSLP